MIGKLIEIEKEKTIVKITKGNNKKIKIISMKLNNVYNFAKTYCSFSCLEDYSKIIKEYKDEKYFCENNGNKIITIEIMKKYDGSLNKLQNTLTKKQTIKILIQILYSIIEAFYKYGFIHEDLSLGNLLYGIKTTNEVVEYNLTKK
jgi:RIO-like serine/threonine protein kinase